MLDRRRGTFDGGRIGNIGDNNDSPSTGGLDITSRSFEPGLTPSDQPDVRTLLREGDRCRAPNPR